MIFCRGIKFRDEDDAYDYFRQLEIDEAQEEQMNAERQQQECEEQRWTESVKALREARRKGVSEESLKTLCFECGIPYKFIYNERKAA